MNNIKRIIHGTIIEQIQNNSENNNSKVNMSNYNYFSEGLSEGLKFSSMVFFIVCLALLLLLIFI